MPFAGNGAKTEKKKDTAMKKLTAELKGKAESFFKMGSGNKAKSGKVQKKNSEDACEKVRRSRRTTTVKKGACNNMKMKE